MNLIQFDGHQVNILNSDGSKWDEKQEPWFLPKQVAEAIGASNADSYARNILNRNPERFDGFRSRLKLSRQETNIINENGLYMFLMASDLPKAIEFQRKVTDLVKRVREGKLNSVVPLDERKVRMELLKTAIEHEERIESVERKIEEIDRKVEEQITLNSGEQRKLQKEISKRVYDLAEREEVQQLGFADESISPDLSKVKDKLFRQLHRAVKDCFAVPSYKDIRRSDFQEVLNYVAAWRPRLVS